MVSFTATSSRSDGALSRSRGFTYLLALFAVAVAGAMLAAGSVVWHHEAQRAREQELRFVGDEIRRAIGLFYERAPGGAKRYPRSLEDLLRDDRYLVTRRYLRRIYRDPLTAQPQWGLVPAPGGGIMGVYSLSEATPLKIDGFDEADKAFTGAQHYADWKFVYVPALITQPPAPSTPPGKPPAAPAPAQQL
jgi:type II secretory pathway pseudopilin PulG